MTVITDYIRVSHGAGTSVADCYAVIAADTRHVRNIMATSSNPDETDLLDLLGSEFGVLRINKDAVWTGSLITYFDELDIGNDNETDTVEQQQNRAIKEGFELLLTQLQITNRPVRCHSSRQIGQLTTSITLIVGNIINNIADVQFEMDKLTGGLVNAEWDLQAVQDEYDRLDAEAALQVKQNALDAIHTKAQLAIEAAETEFRSPSSDVASIAAAADTSWNG